METLFQSNSFSTVKVARGGQLLADSSLVSTDYDATGQLLVDYQSYRIKEARWEICRSPGGVHNGYKDVLELVGVEAYLEAGASLRQAIGDERGGLPRELLSECVKAVVQAESFMFFDRGYKSSKAYEEYWDEMYLNSCRYYSNLQRVQSGWLEEETSYKRTQSLFNRFLVCRVCRLDNGCLTATGWFCDSVHELGVNIDLDNDGIIIKSSGNYLRVPDAVCKESMDLVTKLVGKKPAVISKKEIGGLIGGAQGCVHLVDLVYAISRSIAAALQRQS